MSTAKQQPGGFRAGTLSMLAEQPRLDVGMTDRHYKRVQSRVRTEIRGTHTASIWIAFALAAFGVMAALIITAAWTEIPSATEKGKLEVAAWGAGVVVAVFVVVHFLTRKDADERAADVITEMDTYCYRAVPASRETDDDA